jgi:predicted DNA-binding WGR domain protein
MKNALVKLVCRNNVSNKFYDFYLKDSQIHVRYGAIQGRTLSDRFFCAPIDVKKLAAQMQSKIKKGYVFEFIFPQVAEMSIESAINVLTLDKIITPSRIVSIERFDPAGIDMSEVSKGRGPCPVW